MAANSIDTFSYSSDKELNHHINMYIALTEQIDRWDSEPDSIRKDKEIENLSSQRAILLVELKREFQSECYPEIGDTRFWGWLSDKIKSISAK